MYIKIPNKAAEREFLSKVSERQYGAVQYVTIRASFNTVSVQSLQ
jgi:hypothetical protein